MGRDIGYLPGDKDEKLSAWMQPIFDNLDLPAFDARQPCQTPRATVPSSGSSG
jgi:predicted ribonuclease YlaK